jgi:catechol 2,3-dioxygenase
MTSHQTVRPIDLQVRIGHLHLKVADLERALASYCTRSFTIRSIRS